MKKMMNDNNVTKKLSFVERLAIDPFGVLGYVKYICLKLPGDVRSGKRHQFCSFRDIVREIAFIPAVDLFAYTYHRSAFISIDQVLANLDGG